MSKFFSEDKPWSKLRMSRKAYEAHRLWKKMKLDRKKFEAIVFLLPEDLIDEVYEDANAERLVEAIFGKMNELKDE